MLLIVEEAPALISDSRLAKEADKEAASPVAVALTEESDNKAAERAAWADACAEEADAVALHNKKKKSMREKFSTHFDSQKATKGVKRKDGLTSRSKRKLHSVHCLEQMRQRKRRLRRPKRRMMRLEKMNQTGRRGPLA